MRVIEVMIKYNGNMKVPDACASHEGLCVVEANECEEEREERMAGRDDEQRVKKGKVRKEGKRGK